MNGNVPYASFTYGWTLNNRIVIPIPIQQESNPIYIFHIGNVKNMRNIISVLLLFISTHCISQMKEGLSLQDSLFLSSNKLSQSFIKIKYVGDQDHPMPTIYIENGGRNNDNIKRSCNAARIMKYSFVAYTFLYQEDSYQTIKKCVLDNMKYVHCDSSFDKYGGFEICIKNEKYIDTMYAYSFQFLEDLKYQFKSFNNPCYLWIIPAIDELEFYSRYYIKPDKYNKREN